MPNAVRSLVVATLITLVVIALFVAVACTPPGGGGTTTTSTTTSTTSTTSLPAGPDETPTVQAALDATGTFHVDRAYRIDSPLVPPAGSTITFGPNGKFVRTDALGYGIRKWPIIELAHGNITILDPVIEGPNTGRYSRALGSTTYLYAHEGTGIGGIDPNMEESGGLYFTGGSGYVIRNPRITSVWGDGITLNEPTENVVITNPDIRFVGRSIVSNVGSRNVRIEGGYGTGAYWWGVNIETIGDRLVENFEVTGLELWYTRYESLFAGGFYSNCEIYDVDVQLHLPAPKYDEYPHLRDSAVKITNCPVGRISVTTHF